jgi:hypothetical protein
MWSTAPVPWMCVLVTWAMVGLVGLVWLAGRTASALTGHGWVGPELGIEFGVALTRQPIGPAKFWPDVPAGALAAVVIVLLAVIMMSAGGVVIVWRGRHPAPVGLRGLAAEPAGPSAYRRC